MFMPPHNPYEIARRRWAAVGVDYTLDQYMRDLHGEGCFPNSGAGLGWYGWQNLSGSPGFGVGYEYLAPNYRVPHTFQRVFAHNPHARASVQGFGVGWNPFADAVEAYQSFLRERGIVYVEDPHAFVAVPMLDFVGELHRNLVEMGAFSPDVPFSESVRQVQARLGVPVTGVLDGVTLNALERWGSAAPAMLVTCLDILGTEATRNGTTHALQRLQARYGLPETGAVDAETARILRRQVYNPSDDEMDVWLDLETPPSRREFYADLEHGALQDLREAANNAVADPLAWLKRFVKRVGRDPITYAGLVGSVVVGAITPSWPALKALAVVPMAGALLYELSDEASKDSSG